MVFTTFIKCQICGFITRVRLQVGQQEEHPIEVACGKCGTSLSGSVKIGQDRPGLSFSFDNADEVQDENSDYIKLTKASRYHFCLDSEDYTGFLKILVNAKLRNAIGHNDVEYNSVDQLITYIPNPKDRTKKKTEYLLEFENEAMCMFQAILGFSEYLYRLRKLELMHDGKFLLWFRKEQIGRRRQAAMNCVHVEVERSISVVMGDESIQKFVHCLLQSDLSKKEASYMKKKKDEITIRSSAAEYLTYVASVGDQQDSIEMRYEDENIWLTQKMMATLYDVGLPTINEHIKKIYADSELEESATIRNFRIVQTEGSRQVTRDTKHYNLQMIIAVGFKVNNERAVQFRKWANGIVKDYTIKGWVMDDERLKNGGSVLTTEYFDRLLEQIREIRLSERRFYQKITDIYATALDYDRTAKTTKQFFAKVQNKMHYAVHGHTAAELIYERADADKPHMGLTTWAAAPEGKIVKSDVSVAKNYLSEQEMRSLERIVSAYLDLAEDRAERHIPMTMEDWAKRLDLFLMADDREVLQNAGKITAEIAKAKAETEFEKYRVIQDRLFMSDFDKYMLELEENAKK